MEEIKIFCQGQCKEIYDVYDNEEFAKDFIKLEQKHSQVCTELVRLTPKLRTNMKMAVMYAKEGQKHASDWFANGTGEYTTITSRRSNASSRLRKFTRKVLEVDEFFWKGGRHD